DNKTLLGAYLWRNRIPLTACGLERGQLKKLMYRESAIFNTKKLSDPIKESFKNVLAPKLTTRELARLSSTCKGLNRLFQEELTVPVLLKEVAYGKQDQAEQRLKDNPGLALKKDFVSDYSARRFNKISAVQYAAWALDMHMLRMLIKGMSNTQKL